MNKIFFSIILFICLNCLSLLFQKKASIKGENINIIRNKKHNFGKLPDSIQDITPNLSNLSYISDIVIKLYILIYIYLVFNTPLKYDIFYHSLIILSLILFLRVIMFSSTILPSINVNCHIKKKKIYKKPFSTLLFDFITQKYDIGYCNDYIFSGHNAIFLLITLMILHYQLVPYTISILLCSSTIIFSLFTIICRNHYTIDIILAYFITFSIFTIYYK